MFRCPEADAWKARRALDDLMGPFDMSDPIHMGANPDRYDLRFRDGECLIVAVREAHGGR